MQLTLRRSFRSWFSTTSSFRLCPIFKLNEVQQRNAINIFITQASLEIYPNTRHAKRICKSDILKIPQDHRQIQTFHSLPTSPLICCYSGLTRDIWTISKKNKAGVYISFRCAFHFNNRYRPIKSCVKTSPVV